jgi:hypothetical protein
METRDVRRRHKNGTHYKDREILIDLPDTLGAFVTPIARYVPAEATKRKRYTFQPPCQSCGEVHSRTRKIFCDGCGSEYEPDRRLPIVAEESTSPKIVEVDSEDKVSPHTVPPPTYMGTKIVEVDSSATSTIFVQAGEPPGMWGSPGTATYPGSAGNDRFTG